jgi:hypothetical protein
LEKKFLISIVTLTVRAKLLGPEFTATFWNGRAIAPVRMPVATMNEYDHSITWKDEIRTTGKRTIMQAVSQPSTVEGSPQQQFRAGVFLPDT